MRGLSIDRWRLPSLSAKPGTGHAIAYPRGLRLQVGFFADDTEPLMRVNMSIRLGLLPI